MSDKSKILNPEPEGSGGGNLLGCMNDWRKQSGITCSFLVFSALNIGMMVVGIQAVHKCPVQPMIPNYLIGKEIVI